MLDESTQKRDAHEIHLFWEVAVVDVRSFLNQSDKLFQQLITILFSESSSNLVSLSCLLSNKRHDESQTIDQNVFILAVHKFNNNRKSIFLQEDILDILREVTHVDNGHNWESCELGSVFFGSWDNFGKRLYKIDEFNFAHISIIISTLFALAEEFNNSSAAGFLDIVSICFLNNCN